MEDKEPQRKKARNECGRQNTMDSQKKSEVTFHFEALWDKLNEAEGSASQALDDFLPDFDAVCRSCYALAIEVIFLPGVKKLIQRTPSLKVAALFLRRALNDLRGTWVLVSRGYTSQAACVAASLWENALVVSCVAGRDDLAELCMASEDGDIPWKPEQLAKKYSDLHGHGGTDEHKVTTELKVYAIYKWLCRLKHPNLPSAVHDSLSGGRGPEQGYMLMAIPDVRHEDKPIKTLILFQGIERIMHSVSDFAKILDRSVSDRDVWQDFQFRLNLVNHGLDALADTHMKQRVPLRLTRRFREKANSRLKSSRFEP